MIENVETTSDDKFMEQRNDTAGTHAVKCNKDIPVDLSPSQIEHKLFVMIENCF